MAKQDKEIIIGGIFKKKPDQIETLSHKYHTTLTDLLTELPFLPVVYGIVTSHSPDEVRNNKLQVNKKIRLFKTKFSDFNNVVFTNISKERFPVGFMVDAYDKVYREPLFETGLAYNLLFSKYGDELLGSVQFTIKEKYLTSNFIQKYFHIIMETYNCIQGFIVEDRSERLPSIYYLYGGIYGNYYTPEENSKVHSILDINMYFKKIPHIGLSHYFSDKFLLTLPELKEILKKYEVQQGEKGVFIHLNDNQRLEFKQELSKKELLF